MVGGCWFENASGLAPRIFTHVSRQIHRLVYEMVRKFSNDQFLMMIAPPYSVNRTGLLQQERPGVQACGEEHGEDNAYQKD